MPVTWMRDCEQFTDAHLHAGNCSGAQTWTSQGPGRQQTGPLSSLLLQKAAVSTPQQLYAPSEPRSSRTPERVSRSQPASPARSRRMNTGKSQHPEVRSSTPSGITGTVSAGSGTSHSRSQVGFWNRTYCSRPASNPAPSRANNGPHGSSGHGRSATPGRSQAGNHLAQAAWGYTAGASSNQGHQLDDLFTTQALKVPQRFSQSPYLSSGSKPTQASTIVPQASNPYSPKARSCIANAAVHAQQQQQQPYTTSGSGGLLSADSPVARAKLNCAFSVQRSGSSSRGSPKGQSGRCPSPVPEPCASPELVFGRPSRGPGALVAHSPHRPTTQTSSDSNGTVARSSAFRSSRYTGGSATNIVSVSSSSSRQRSPTAANSASSSMSNIGLSAHKQSVRQHQQQMQQHQQQPRQAWVESQASLDQPQLLSQTSSHHQQCSQVPLVLNASSQLSGISVLGPSSSSSTTGRPLTAKGSSRAELRAEVTPNTNPGMGGSGQQMGMNLDPHSWSTFLSVSAGKGQQPSASAAAALSALGIEVPQQPLAYEGGVVESQQQATPGKQQIVQSATHNCSPQSQMLADLGFGGIAAVANTTRSRSTGSSVTGGAVRSAGTEVVCSQHLPGQLNSSATGGGVAGTATCNRTPGGVVADIQQADAGHCASQNGSGSDDTTDKTILRTAAANAANQAAAGSVLIAAGRRSQEGSSTEGAVAAPPSSPGGTRTSQSSATAGPLHAGLLRPRSGQGMLHQVTQQQQQPQQLAALQQIQPPSSPQHQTYLSSLQQQQQQNSSSSPQQLQKLDPRHSASPASRFVQTPDGLLRRKSLTELQGYHKDAVPSSTGEAGSSQAAVQQQQQSSTVAQGSPCAGTFTSPCSRDACAAAAVAQSCSPGGCSSVSVSPCRRPSDIGTSSTGSPLARLQSDQWGTLTAMSRGSGFGAGASGFDSEASADCQSTASWGSGGGALGTAAAAAGGLSPASGPGPSPLSMSSMSHAHEGSPGSEAQSSSGGSFSAAGSAAGGVRRSLQFGDAALRTSGSGAGHAGAAAAVDPGTDASRHRLSNSSRSNSITSQQQQQSTPSKDGSSTAPHVQATSSSSRAVTAPQQQQQQQQVQQQKQYLQQLQQQHQVIQQAVNQAAVQQQARSARPATVPDGQSPAARPTSINGINAAATAPAAAVRLSTPLSTLSQPVEPAKESRRTVSDYSDEDSAPSSNSTSGAAAAQPAASAAAAATAPKPAAATSTATSDDDALLLPGYSVSRVVGEGGFCQVRLATHHLSRRKVAVKVIDKTKLSDNNEASRIQREIRVLKRLNHPAIIRLFEVLEAESKLFLVMEYAPSGSLLDYVRSRKRLSEGESAYFLQQIVAGLQYCHENEVVHRDIKLENILLDAANNMKLIDFGLAAFYAPGKRLRVHCGSPSYAAPEIVARKLYEGPPVDVWSLGVVLFAMMAGFLPFHSPTGNKQELCQKIMAGTYNAPDWVSPAAKDLLSRMLIVDPERRITLTEVAAHPFTRGSGPVWELPAVNCYAAPPVITGVNGTEEVAADKSLLAELEIHGYPRTTTLRHLATGETNYVTASYYLLAEGKAEAARKLLPPKPWPFQPVAVHSNRSGGSRTSGQRASTSSSRPSTSQQATAATAAACAGAANGAHVTKAVAAVAAS